MLILFTVAVLSIIGCTDNRSPVSEIEGQSVVFTGRVNKVEMLGNREITFFPVGTDPQYLLVVKVEKVEGDTSSPIVAGETINLGIPSPGRLFGADDPTGKRFRFTALWRAEPYKDLSWAGPPLPMPDDH